MWQWLRNLLGVGEETPEEKKKREDKKRHRDDFYSRLERDTDGVTVLRAPKMNPAPNFGGATLKLYEEPDTMYNSHPEAVIVACFFNPQNSPYRLLAFQKWYRSIKHLNHRIIELLIGDDAESQLPKSPYITTIETESLLFHKESLLNKVIAELPTEFKYVFWVDADVLFTNPNWLVDGVEALKTYKVIQPFEYGIHLERNQLKPNFPVEGMREYHADAKLRQKTMWRSFCANYVDNRELTTNPNYDIHGHVGFAWAARREVLDMVQLYDRALIGGADHIIAHAAAGQVPCVCISRAFTLELDDVVEWSKQFYDVVQGSIGYVKGDLYHIWHGDIKDREYLKRIREFATEIAFITRRDSNGLWVYDGKNPYMKRYYRKREAVDPIYYEEGFDGFDFGFVEDMGYALADLINSFGQPTYEDEVPGQWQQDPVPVQPSQPWDQPEAVVPTQPVMSESRPYEPGYFDYKSPAADATAPFEPATVPDQPSAPADAPVQSFTPSYEPGHWDYTPPGQDPAQDMGSTFS